MVTETGEWSDTVITACMIGGGLLGILQGSSPYQMVNLGLLGSIFGMMIPISYWFYKGEEWH